MAEAKKNSSRWKNFRSNPDKAIEASKESWTCEEFTLMFHTAHFSSSDLILKQEVFSGILDKEIIEIIPQDTNYPPFVVQVSSDSFTSKANLTLSISSQLASLLGLASLRSLEVRVKRLSGTKYDCEELVVSIKDQHICRSDIWKCSEGYRGMAVYKSQLISKSSFRAVVSHLVSDSKSALTAVITKATKITLRTKSCRVIWMVEMSQEMWEFSPSGILYWEKMLTFINTAFERQLIRKVNHDLSIVFFTKITSEGQTMNIYREILRITDLRSSWVNALGLIKREIIFFPSLVNWDINATCTAKSFKEMCPLATYLGRDIAALNLHPSLIYYASTAPISLAPTFVHQSCESHILEAINYTLTKVWEEDSKNTTGNTIMVISAGTGLYYTSQALAKVSKLRVLSQGVSVNIMSMKRPPMHPSPLFVYGRDSNEEESKVFIPKLERANSLLYSKQKYKPGWIHIHFFFSFMQFEGTCNLQSAIHTQVHERPKKFQPLFRLTGIPGSGVPHIKSSLSSEVKYNPNDLAATVSGIKFQLKTFDSKIFIRNETNVNSEEFLRGHDVFRKATESNDRRNDRKVTRKESFDTARRDTLVGTPPQRDSMLSSHGSYHITKRIYSSLKRRWADCYKVIKECPDECLKDEHKFNNKKALEHYESVWSNLLEPCLLPIFNDFWPLEKDLGVSQPYHSYVSERITRELAINNIIGSRLNRGFQIVKKTAIDSFGHKFTQPEIALSLGAAYHVIRPDTNDEINLVYMVYCPKAATVQASGKIAVFNGEILAYEENDHHFSFTYPATWDDSDSKMLGHIIH